MALKSAKTREQRLGSLAKPRQMRPLSLEIDTWPVRQKRLVGAPGFEPGNGGIKIRCLTAWLRPNDRKRRNLPKIEGGSMPENAYPARLDAPVPAC